MSILPRKEQTIGLIDLASASVGAAVVKINRLDNKSAKNNCRTEFIFSTREDLSILSHNLADKGRGRPTWRRFMFETKKVLSQIMGKIDQLPVKPKIFHFFLSSPFYLAGTQPILIKQPKPFLVTETLIHTAATEAERLFIANQSGQHPEREAEPLIVLERKLMDFKLNGYRIDRPIGSRASELEGWQFISATSADTARHLRDLALFAAGGRNFSFHTSALALFDVCRDAFPRTESFLIVDVSGELSDVLSIVEGSLREIASFPVGARTLLGHLASLLHRLPLEVSALLELRQKKHLALDIENKISAAIEKVSADWLNPFKDICRLFLRSANLPEKVVLVIDSPIARIFTDWLGKASFPQLKLSTSPFSVISFDHLSLHGLCHYGTMLESPAEGDVFLSAESLFIHKIMHLT